MNRRGFLRMLGAALAFPAALRLSQVMPEPILVRRTPPDVLANYTQATAQAMADRIDASVFEAIRLGRLVGQPVDV